jgi:hypothetical protein
MRVVKGLGIVLLGLVLTLALAGIFLPTTYRVERSVHVEAPGRTVWAQIVDLRKHEAWSPWKAADPSVVTSYPGNTVGDGASYSWTSDDSGSGTFTVVRTDEPRRLDYELDLGADGKASGALSLEPSGTGTRVTWSAEGTVTTVGIAAWLAMAMDGLLGPRFEDGLARLAKIAEAAPPPPPLPSARAAIAPAAPPTP